MNRFFDGRAGGRYKEPSIRVFDIGGYDSEKRNVHNLSLLWAFAIVAGVLVLGAISKYQLHSLPRALTANDEAHNLDTFIAERARVDLRILNDFGPRVTGSHANEVLAVDFLKREIAHIQTNAHPAQKIYADVQRVSGAYYADFRPHGFTSVYRDVQNVLAKLVGARERNGIGNETLLLNCHFDSVAGSPGASDDAASCAVMLEVLRLLAQSENVLQHSVLLLFNGAEETPLQASHGFVTQHAWATAVRAFLNLESAGSGGKEFLFQSGPEHAWLIDMYKASAPHPQGHVAGEEIFQSGLIPSDTDFRIFRDFGHIPGMDFAHVLNGYRYHTKYDTIDYVPGDVLQRTGDNILALVRRIADSEQLLDTARYAKSPGGRRVYFDVLGLWFVAYSEYQAMFLNAVVAIAAVTLPYVYLRRATRGTHAERIRTEMWRGASVLALGATVALFVCHAIAWEVDAAGHALVWYRHTVFAVILYCVPTVAVLAGVQRLFDRTGGRCGTAAVIPLSAGLTVQAQLNGVNAVWAMILVAGTAFGVRSVYVCMVPLAVSAVSSAVIALGGFGNSIRKWLYVHLVGQAVFVLWATHLYHILTALFIPIGGRLGSTENPETILAFICWMMTVYIACYLIPLVALLRRTHWFLGALLVVFVLTRWGCISMTNTGFPYRGGTTDNPTPQRHMITHTVRTVFDASGQPAYSDSGFYFRDMDRNAHRTLESLIAPDLLLPQEQNALCQKRPFCGLPFHSGRQLHTGGFWLPGPAPILKEEAHINNVTIVHDSDTKHTITFNINGPVLLSLQLQLRPGVELAHWNILHTVPKPNVFQQREQYIVMMTHGLAAETYPVELQLRTQPSTLSGALWTHGNPLIDVSLVTVHWEYHKEHTATFAGLLAKLPDWAFAVPAVASVQSWTY